MQRLFRVLLFLAAIGLLAWMGWTIRVRLKEADQGNKGQGNMRRGGAVAVEVAPIKVQPIVDMRVFSGTLEAKAAFTVAPKVAGRLEKLSVDVGDLVAPGQLIAVLESEEFAQRVEQARAELTVAEAAVEQVRVSEEVARREYERAKALREKQVASESELDAAAAEAQSADARLKVAKAQVAQAAAALRAAEVQLSYTQVTAAWVPDEPDEKRVVGQRFVAEGAMLRANDPVVSVLDVVPLLAVITVTERDYARLEVGHAARVTTDAYAGRSFEGKVSRIAPLLKETSREARVEIEVPNREGLLKPGMFAQVHIELGRREQAVTVPADSIVRREGQQGVFLVQEAEKTARFVPVETGIRQKDIMEIVSPPLEGRVVSLGQHLLEDGANLLLPETAAPGASSEAGAGAGAGGAKPGAGAPAAGGPRAGGGA